MRPTPAQREAGAPASRIDRPVTDLLERASRWSTSFNLSPSARAKTDEPESISCEDDDVLEIEVEGGFTTWTSAKRYPEDMPLLKPEAKVDGAVIVDTLPQVSDRGVAEWVANRLRILRVKQTSSGYAC